MPIRIDGARTSQDGIPVQVGTCSEPQGEVPVEHIDTRPALEIKAIPFVVRNVPLVQIPDAPFQVLPETLEIREPVRVGLGAGCTAGFARVPDTDEDSCARTGRGRTIEASKRISKRIRGTIPP